MVIIYVDRSHMSRNVGLALIKLYVLIRREKLYWRKQQENTGAIITALLLINGINFLLKTARNIFCVRDIEKKNISCFLLCSLWLW